jgi:hypothetical protein
MFIPEHKDPFFRYNFNNQIHRTQFSTFACRQCFVRNVYLFIFLVSGEYHWSSATLLEPAAPRFRAVSRTASAWILCRLWTKRFFSCFRNCGFCNLQFVDELRNSELNRTERKDFPQTLTYRNEELYCHVVCVTITGFGLVNRFIDHLQVVTTNNYNNIANSTLYSSLEHTV